MMNRDNAIRDTFAMSLGGVTAVTPFTAMPTIPYDRLRKDLTRTQSKPRPFNWRAWMPRRSRVA